MTYYLIGPYPPPLGGVSVFIYRFTKFLKIQSSNVTVIDFGKKKKIYRLLWLLRFCFNPKKSTYDLNVIDFYSMLALILRPFPGKIIFRDHSGRLIENLNSLQILILKIFLKKVDECIFVGEHITNYYFNKGLKPSRNLLIQNAFVPPPIEDEAEIWKSYDEEILHFIKDRKPLIIANAFQIAFHNGIDLYGLDMCASLISYLKEEYPDVGLLFGLADIGDETYFRKINHEIRKQCLDQNFLFMLGQKELWPLFRKADLMVRPTYVDGYGISVAEALYFSCPAIASDVCMRPEGTILFTNRDTDDLLEKSKEVLRWGDNNRKP